MSKFGLEGLTKSMVMDLGKHGIRVNTVAPTKTIVNKEEKKKNRKLNIIKKKMSPRKFLQLKRLHQFIF